MNRRCWLVKSGPESYSFNDLLAEPGQTAEWDGVRNFQARNNLQAMRPGDGVLFYHSNAKPNAIVGLATVVREAYPDHTAWDPNSMHPDAKSTQEHPIWFMVDLRAERTLRRPVPLEAIKPTPGLEQMALLRNSRLSVQPVTEQEWALILKLAGE